MKTLQISLAEDGGAIVQGPRTQAMSLYGLPTPVLFAGTLGQAMDYAGVELRKADDDRRERQQRALRSHAEVSATTLGGRTSQAAFRTGRCL